MDQIETVEDTPTTDRKISSTSRPGADRSSQGKSKRSLVALAVVCVLLAGTSWFTVREWNERGQDNEAIDARSAAIALAKTAALGLSNLAPDTIEKQMASLIKISDGTFLEQLKNNQAGQINSVRKGKVRSVGTIDAVGVVSSDDKSVVVAIALTAKVTGAKVTKPEVNLYRLKVSVAKKSGTWLVTNVEFVS
ncbi:MAG: hypothetical protein JWR83_2628 [Aeromicrobium sp.]|nr:hypothetical protein [Aeromicrobium sp.]